MKGFKFIVVLLFPLCLFAQNPGENIDKWDYFDFNGYIKSLQIASFETNFDDILNDNIIHNRLNFKIYPDSNWTIALELRNRILFGETVELIPSYGDLIAVDDGLVDLSWLIVNERSLIFLSQIDRAWLDWSNDSWEVRIGRQRINWGTNLYWNSNDLFNAYSLVDFDYEERPGSDAIRIQKHFENFSSFDVAVKPGNNEDEWIAALKYQFNTSQYDIQLLGGWWNTDIVIGAGWAGNLGMAGFKGELSYFHPRKNTSETKSVISSSLSVDYMFESQLFITGGFLFNSAGISSKLGSAQNLFFQDLSAKSLMASKYNILLSLTYPFSPLFNGSIVQIYSPGVNSALIMPSIGYSVAENWELAFFGQCFWLELDSFQNIGNSFFLRIKGSF
jgi:hypothetical protein